VGNRSIFGYAQPEDGVYIGYRVDGDGPIDIVQQPEWPGNIDMDWQAPVFGPWLQGLASFARVITHDHRGVGVSSRDVEIPTLETRVSDLLSVLKATASRRPVLMGFLASRSRQRLARRDASRASTGDRLVGTHGPHELGTRLPMGPAP
jgi:hypothetical protein